MKKLLPLLFCLLLCGCAAQALPEGMEEETVIKEGQAIVNLLVDECYGDVYASLREDVAQGTSAETIKKLMEDTVDGLGAYQGREDAMATGRTVDGVDYGEAVILCKYKKDTVLFRIAFDVDYTLVGMEISKK